MPEYLVEWTIELEADSPEEAARLALAIQRDPNSTATVFYVREIKAHKAKRRVDVSALDDYADLVRNNVPCEDRGGQ